MSKITYKDVLLSFLFPIGILAIIFIFIVGLFLSEREVKRLAGLFDEYDNGFR